MHLLLSGLEIAQLWYMLIQSERDSLMRVLAPLLCKKGVALVQKGGTRTLGPEAG